MTKRVLLVNPPVHDFAAFDLFAKPHGLLYLGGYLRSCGYKIELLDCMDRFHPAMTHLPMEKTRANGCGKYYAERITKPEVIKNVPRYYYHFGMPTDVIRTELEKYKNSGIDAILVTGIMTYWYTGVKEMISLLRQVIPGVPVLLGGIYASLMPEHAKKECQPDEVITSGNMSYTLKLLDKYCRTETAALPTDFASWPDPAYDLYKYLPYLSLTSSLGCCFKCDYCASSILQPKFQQCSPDKFSDQVIRLSKLIKDQNNLNIAFQDDALLVDADNRFIPIMKKLISCGLPLKLHSPNGLHCRYITEEIASLMYKAGFDMIRLSYEASDDSPEFQAASDNKVNDSFFQLAIANLKKAGYRSSQIEAYILNGLPGQTIEQMEKSALAVNRCGVKARLCQFTPIPGTKMFEQACRLMNIPSDEPLLHNNSLMLSKAGNISDEQFQKFKNRIHDLNAQLDSQAKK